MKKNKLYNIPVKNARQGKHLFEYQIDKLFFDAFENEDVREGNLVARLSLEPKRGVLELNVNIEGYIESRCDRCLEKMNVAVSIDERLHLREGEEPSGNQDINVIFTGDEEELDIAPLLNDLIVLAKPVKVVHSGEGKDVCNPGMLALLDGYTSRESQETGRTNWSALEELRNKMSNEQ